MKQRFNVSQGTLNADFLEAAEILRKEQEGFLNELRSVIVERYELLWRMATEKGDVKTAATLLKQMSSLFGLDAPTAVSIDDGTFTISFN